MNRLSIKIRVPKFSLIFLFILGVIIMTMGVLCIVYPIKSTPNEIIYKTENAEFLMSELPTEEVVWKALIYYDVKHPAIVYAQAFLETGNFKSRVCIENNNLFGLYNSRKGEYLKFNHWSESIIYYRDYIQNRYKEGKETYYEFLTRINYATDPLYIEKLKFLINNLSVNI